MPQSRVRDAGSRQIELPQPGRRLQELQRVVRNAGRREVQLRELVVAPQVLDPLVGYSRVGQCQCRVTIAQLRQAGVGDLCVIEAERSQFLQSLQVLEPGVRDGR